MTLRTALEKPVIERRPSLTARSGSRVRLGATTLIDLVAPDGVDRRWNHMVQVGDSYVTTLELRGFPPSLPLAWLTDPALGLDAPGITVHQRIAPVPDALARRMLAKSEDAALGTLMGDVADFRWGLQQIRAGKIRPLLDRALPLAEAAEAHRLIAANAVNGNLVLKP